MRCPNKNLATLFDLLDRSARLLCKMERNSEVPRPSFMLALDHALRNFAKFAEEIAHLQSSFPDNQREAILNSLDNSLFGFMRILVRMETSACIFDSNATLIQSLYKCYKELKAGLSPALEIYFDFTFNFKLQNFTVHFETFRANKLLIFTIVNALAELLRQRDFVLELFAATELRGHRGGSIKILLSNAMGLIRNLMKTVEEPADVAFVKDLEARLLKELHEYMTQSSLRPTRHSINESELFEQDLARLLGFFGEAEEQMSSPKKFNRLLAQSYPRILDSPASDHSVQKNPLILYLIQQEATGEQLTSVIGADTPESERLRRLFIGLFDVAGLSIDKALRRFILIFKMKGETQLIERILKSTKEGTGARPVHPGAPPR